MKIERCVVDNRVFLLGLDEIYRETMKRHECGELLQCARKISQILSIPPANVPIEGYYYESEELTEYFRLLRALQEVPKSRESELHAEPAFRRLRQITESNIFGTPVEDNHLLSVSRDALAKALIDCRPDDWTIESLTSQAYHQAQASDEISLVALAALSRDAVVLTALVESVVIYREWILLGAKRAETIRIEYVWEVDEIIEKRAQKFVSTFNELFNESIPAPGPRNAERFWAASDQSKIVGRCVRIGVNPLGTPREYYHWAIDLDAGKQLTVKDFWDSKVWTTERYRKMGKKITKGQGSNPLIKIWRRIVKT